MGTQSGFFRPKACPALQSDVFPDGPMGELYHQVARIPPALSGSVMNPFAFATVPNHGLRPWTTVVLNPNGFVFVFVELSIM